MVGGKHIVEQMSSVWIPGFLSWRRTCVWWRFLKSLHDGMVHCMGCNRQCPTRYSKIVKTYQKASKSHARKHIFLDLRCSFFLSRSKYADTGWQDTRIHIPWLHKCCSGQTYLWSQRKLTVHMLSHYKITTGFMNWVVFHTTFRKSTPVIFTKDCGEIKFLSKEVEAGSKKKPDTMIMVPWTYDLVEAIGLAIKALRSWKLLH